MATPADSDVCRASSATRPAAPDLAQFIIITYCIAFATSNMAARSTGSITVTSNSSIAVARASAVATLTISIIMITMLLELGFWVQGFCFLGFKADRAQHLRFRV